MKKEIKKVACVGCGMVGQGWVALLVSAGYRIAMHDVSEDVLKQMVEQVQSNLERLEEIDRISTETATRAAELIETTTDVMEWGCGIRLSDRCFAPTWPATASHSFWISMLSPTDCDGSPWPPGTRFYPG